MIGLPTPSRSAPGSRVSSNEATTPDTFIGSSSWPSPPRNLLQELRNVLAQHVMPNSPDQRLRTPISRRMTPTLMEPDSSLELNPFVVTRRRIGRNAGQLRRPEMSNVFRHMYVYNVIGPFEQLELIISNLSQLSESAMYIGVELEQANQDGLGMRPDWILTLRIPEQSFGMVTNLKNMLLSVS